MNVKMSPVGRGNKSQTRPQLLSGQSASPVNAERRVGGILAGLSPTQPALQLEGPSAYSTAAQAWARKQRDAEIPGFGH